MKNVVGHEKTLIMAIPKATIVVVTESTTITSTAVNSMAIVTDVATHKSYIECYFQTPAGQIGLHLVSKDQRRVTAPADRHVFDGDRVSDHRVRELAANRRLEVLEWIIIALIAFEIGLSLTRR